jgi:hypothetical protein
MSPKDRNIIVAKATDNINTKQEINKNDGGTSVSHA